MMKKQINPIDVGRDVGYKFAKLLLTEEQPKIKKIIGVFAGRFQPFHRGHKSIYDALAQIVGKNNVYIGTSNVTEPGRSPFNFREKQKIISTMFGIPKNKIVQVRSPFAPEEILKKFDPKTTAVITAFSEKDVGRLGGKYYKPFKRGIDLKGYEDEGYFIVPPVYNLSVDGQNVSGTALRNFFSDPNKNKAEKEAMMKKIYGKSDPRILGMFINKFGGKKESIEIPIEVGDTILTGRFKNKKTVVKTIGKDEHGMPTINGRKVTTFRIAPKKEGLDEDMISRVLIKNFRDKQQLSKLIKEGGAQGHMNHPFDDMNLTFGDLKTMVELGLEGRLDIEAPVTEKLDGQNISVSYKDGKVLFARNKGHMKNQGANALSASGIKSMFAGRGELTKAFAKAAKDLESGISQLSARQQDKIFANGKKWMSMEILYPQTQNVIPYGRNMLVFHHTMEVDDNGNVINIEKGEGRMLAGMLKQISQDIQKTFQFRGPVVVKLPKVGNFGVKKGRFISQISRLQNQFNLSDTDPVMMWHQAWWMDFINKQAQKMGYGIPNNVLMGLVKRWAFLNTGDYRIADMKREIKDEKFLDWALKFDKGSKEKQFKNNISKFETIFLKLGAEILSNATGFLNVAPTSAAQSIRKEVESAVKELKSTKDVKKITTLKTQLKKLQSIGIDKIVPSEGITFMFKGRLMKLTGAFAPIGQILGLLRY